MKRLLYRSVLLLCIACLYSSCKTLPDSELSKRYSQVLCQDSITSRPRDLVEIKAFSLPNKASSDSTRDIFALKEAGQAALINATLGKYKKGSDLKPSLEQLMMPLSMASETGGTDQTTIRRRVVFSIKNKSGSEANRISKISITLRMVTDSMNSDPARFISWNRINSDYQTLEIGKLNSTGERKLEVAPEVSLPSGSAKGGAYLDNTSLTVEKQVKQRYIVTSGTLDDHTATIYQESIEGIDLSGNVTADLDVEMGLGFYVLYKFNNLFNRKGSPNTSITTQRKLVRAPLKVEDLKCTLDYSYTLRDVKEGESTVYEGDDAVCFISGTVTGTDTIKFVPADDLIYKYWKILYVNELRWDKDSCHFLDLKLRLKGEKAEDIMRFATADDAQEFIRWLQRSGSIAIKNEGSLYLGKERDSTLSTKLKKEHLKYLHAIQP